MKTKKGIVLPETLKIIIAVMCILLLLYLAFELYDIFRRSNELEQAKATLEAIVGKANSLKEGESTEYLITGPRGWRIMTYKDAEKNYLCVCPPADVRDWNSLDEQRQLCFKQGICKDYSFLFLIGGVDNTCFLGKIGYSAGLSNCMEIKTKILNIFKTKESVTLSFPIENKGETTKTSSVKGQLSIEGQVKELFFILDTTLNDRLKLDLTPALNQITTKRGYRVYLFVYKENKCRRKVTNGNCIPVYLTAPNNDKYFVGEAYPDGSLWLALGFLRNDFEYGSELRIIEPRADNSYASGQVRVYKTNIDLDFNSFLNQLRNLE